MKFLYVYLLFILPVMWILIHLSPWIQIQRYKMKGKAEFNKQIFGVFFRRKLNSELKFGSESAFIKFCGSAYDQCGSTSLHIFEFSGSLCATYILTFLRGFGETGGVKTQILDIIRSVRKT